jgi:lambda repressor-like predicted transcriptional regulator
MSALVMASTSDIATDYIWAHRFPDERDYSGGCRKSKSQKDRQLQTWKRNDEILRGRNEGLTVSDLSKRYGLSRQYMYRIVDRERYLQEVLSSVPSKKVTMRDLGPFRRGARNLLLREDLFDLPIEKFYQTEDAASLRARPLCGRGVLREIAFCLKSEGFDITKYEA